MEGVGSEVSLKIRSAIKAKLVELGTYVGVADEELPDYIMVLVANKKTKDQMDDDLSLFLGHNTERFTSWLHHVLQKLNAAALLQVTQPVQEETKRKETEDEALRLKEEEKKREKEEEKKRAKAEEQKRLKEEEKRRIKEREKIERKRKSSEKKEDKKKLKKSVPSPPPQEKLTKEKKLPVEPAKPVKSKEVVKEKEVKEKVAQHKEAAEEVSQVTPPTKTPQKKEKKARPLVRSKISSADIFRAEVGEGEASGGKGEKDTNEEEDIVEDMLELRADVDELQLELEEEVVPKKSKGESSGRHKSRVVRTEEPKPDPRPDPKTEPPRIESRVEPKIESRLESKIESKIESKLEPRLESKIEIRERSKGKPDPPAPRLSAKERLGAVTSKATTARDKPSVLDRLGTVSSSSTSRRVINLREESSGHRSDSSLGLEGTQGMSRALSSAITSAHRSVSILPSSTSSSSSSSSGKKLEARVRPLINRDVGRPARGLVGRGGSGGGEEDSSSDEELVQQVPPKPVGRVVSAVGAVLKRPHTQTDSDEEEYDPKKPQLSSMASKVEVAPRPRRPGAIQANTALILRAMADAHKSVNRPSRRQPEKPAKLDKPEKPDKHQKKQKTELYSRSYRQREVAHMKEYGPEPPEQEEVRVRKIAITVPNATHREGQRLRDEARKKIGREEVKEVAEEEEEEEQEVVLGLDRSKEKRRERSEVTSTIVEVVKKEETKEEQMEVKEQPAATVQPAIYPPYSPGTGYGMEEVEEVEEEMVDESMEEGPPQPVEPQPPTLPTPLVENPKFIVTLEGMDHEDFPHKDDQPHLDVHARLGSRADSLEQVEEYIEEVEEWEEEEEAVGEVGRESAFSRVDLPTGAKGRGRGTGAPLPQPGGKERCRYWPLCKAGEGCPYHHPTITCKSFPNCKFGDKCLFIHPNCIYDASCTRISCPYTHASIRNLSANPAVLKNTRMKCKFFPKCTNMACPYLHPKACYYGAGCTQTSCPFTHPAISTGAKLKWVAPKVASTPASAATTTTTTTPPDKGDTQEKIVIV